VCACDTDLSALDAPDRRSLAFNVVPREKMDKGCRKACYFPESGRIDVDATFWNAWTPAQRDAALAHEVSHRKTACEDCADKLAGGVLAQWGYSSALAADALGSVIDTRPRASFHALMGWQAVAPRLGPAPLDTVRESRARSTLGRIATSTTSASAPRATLPTAPTRAVGAAGQTATAVALPTAPSAGAPVGGGGGGGGGGAAEEEAPAPAQSDSMRTQILAAVVAGVVLYFITRKA
jgi:hypothetical protein